MDRPALPPRRGAHSGADEAAHAVTSSARKGSGFPPHRDIAGRMTVSVNVPLNTMLADLDEALRALLRRELGRHGFDGVEVAFDAPAKDWSATLSAPTVNLFLYDLREAT